LGDEGFLLAHIQVSLARLLLSLKLYDGFAERCLPLDVVKLANSCVEQLIVNRVKIIDDLGADCFDCYLFTTILLRTLTLAHDH
jgi:hypothetical protein